MSTYILYYREFKNIKVCTYVNMSSYAKERENIPQVIASTTRDGVRPKTEHQ